MAAGAARRQGADAEVVLELITPSTLNDGTTLRYSMGLFVGEDSRGLRQIGHDGGGFGFGAVANWYPDAQLAVVVLTNSEPTNIRVVSDDLAAATSTSSGRRVVRAVLPVPPAASPFTGDASLLVGTYKGPGRGRDMVIEVTQTPQGIAFAFDGAAASALPWVEGWTFRQNQLARRASHLPPFDKLRAGPEREQGSGHGTAVRQGRWLLHPQAGGLVPAASPLTSSLAGTPLPRSVRSGELGFLARDSHLRVTTFATELRERGEESNPNLACADRRGRRPAARGDCRALDL